MRRFLAARCAACWLVMFALLSRGASAQRWNDSLSLDVVNRATARRVQQLADTGLADYQAVAHGYVTFLAQLGEGFRTPPKIIKSDELALEVYWHAPNESKQRIVGRRDTLLLPTDIAYHRDHLGIVQNNFPEFIRIGDGDEVRDVPHPLSPRGLMLYDFALTDSFAIGAGAQRIRVREIKVRPKDDTQPRVVGAVYIDASEGQVVRMNLSFTHAAFIDPALEELSIVLENRVVGGRFWLPNRQEIEIRRSGTWMDFPARGIINGRWEIGDYHFNLGLAPVLFTGPEIVQASPAELRKYPWKGKLLDSLPPDVRMATDEDIQRVQEEARALVRAQALSRAQHVTLAARSVSDIARANRVEGFAVGTGASKQFGYGTVGSVRARYGLDDHALKGTGSLDWTHSSGFGLRAFGYNDFRDVADQPERSTMINSVASQEFGSDFTDPYLVRGGGIGIDFPSIGSYRFQLDGMFEREDSLRVHARPVVGRFMSTVPAASRQVVRATLGLDRPAMPWAFGTELAVQGQLRATWDMKPAQYYGNVAEMRTARLFAAAQLERPFGAERLVSRTSVGALRVLGSRAPDGLYPEQELIYLGGTYTAPGYEYHSLVGHAAVSEHLEWQVPVPFPSFSLGRFGRVPATAAIAPYVNAAFIASPYCPGFAAPLGAGSGASASAPIASRRCQSPPSADAVYPTLGVGLLSPFNALRIDIARGTGHGGRWTFGVDLAREFWSIF